MMNRDEYVQKLKTQIDAWNAEAGRWQERMRKAQAGAKAEYERQMENFRRRSEEAMAELRRLQGASTDAWTEMMRGAETSMKSMQEAFEKARRSFDKDQDKNKK
jgi:lipid II:glycine glycyltransferase (peptidoglycan interpeptide bridge formation enzyme)